MIRKIIEMIIGKIPVEKKIDEYCREKYPWLMKALPIVKIVGTFSITGFFLFKLAKKLNSIYNHVDKIDKFLK
jgi:hypothetical protein